LNKNQPELLVVSIFPVSVKLLSSGFFIKPGFLLAHALGEVKRAAAYNKD
jgi:hypothetical protein